MKRSKRASFAFASSTHAEQARDTTTIPFIKHAFVLMSFQKKPHTPHSSASNITRIAESLDIGVKLLRNNHLSPLRKK